MGPPSTARFPGHPINGIPIDVHFEDSLPIIQKSIQDCVSQPTSAVQGRSFRGKVHGAPCIGRFKALHKMITDSFEKGSKKICQGQDTSDLTAWMKDFKGVHAYKKLGEKLYSGDLIL